MAVLCPERQGPHGHTLPAVSNHINNSGAAHRSDVCDSKMQCKDFMRVKTTKNHLQVPFNFYPY